MLRSLISHLALTFSKKHGLAEKPVLLALILSLCACGGGGSSDGASVNISTDNQIQSTLNNISDESLAGFIALGNLIIEDAYNGNTSEISVDETNFPAFAQFLLEQEEGLLASSGAVQAKTTDSNRPLNSLIALSKIDINTTENCNSGNIALNGTVEDDGVGAVQATYNNCTLEGVTVDGDAAIYIQNSQATNFYVIYRDVEISIGNESELLNGIMQFTPNQVVFSMSGEASDGTEYLVEDWTYSISNFGFGLDFESGTIYVPSFGRMFVEKYNDSPSSYRFDGNDAASGFLIDKNDYWLSIIDLTANNAADYLGTALKSELEGSSLESFDLVSLDNFEIEEYMSETDLMFLRLDRGNASSAIINIDIQQPDSSDNTNDDDSPVEFIPLPIAPTILSAIPGDSNIYLDIGEVFYATEYNIYIAEEPFNGSISGYMSLEGGNMITLSSDSQVLLSGLNNGTTYYVVATAQNSSGESSISDQVSATPVASDIDSEIIYGPIDMLEESTTVHIWGINGNLICSYWSVGFFDFSGYMYADDGDNRTVDLFVSKNTSPLEINNADTFEYDTTSFFVEFDEGDTVFFRNFDNFYGAWQITDIAGGESNPTLTGTWYFVTQQGSGDFTGSLAESPSSFQTSSFSVCPQ